MAEDWIGSDDRYGTVEDRLAALHQLPTMVELFVGPDHVTKALNPLVVEYFGGFNPLGYSVREMLEGADEQGMVDIYDRVLAGETVRTDGMRFTLQTLEGHQREVFVEFLMVPFRDRDGNIVGVIASAQDVTERLQRERAEAEAAAELTRRYQRSTDVTEEIQRALLPARLPVLPTLDVAAAYVIGGVEQAAGGDWFDVVTRDDGRVALVVGDVVGHGVTAAATMAHLRAVALDHLFAGEPIEAVVRALDRYVQRVPAGRSATLCIALLEPSTGRFEWTSAGHPPPLVADARDDSAFLAPSGDPPLGYAPEQRRVMEASLAPGQVLVLYTDGIVERPGVDPSAATVELRQAASNAVANRLMPLNAPVGAADRVADQVIERLTRFTGVSDDITLLAASRKDRLVDLHRRLDVAHHPAGEARHALREWLASSGIDPAALDAVGQVVTELVDNAAEHATPSTVTLTGHLDGAGVLTIAVSDNGRWKPQRTGSNERGIGLPLVRQIADDLTVDPGDDGTTASATFTPWRSVRRASSTTPAVTGETFDSAVHDTGDDATLWIRGPLDGLTVTQIQPDLALCFAPRYRHLVIDMNDVTILASTGIHALRTFIQQFQHADRTITFTARPGSPAHRALVLAGLLA